jgi:hypothetical protein
MNKKEEYVEVKVKVPKRFLRLIEGENYFGWTKEQFWTNCVKAFLSALFSEAEEPEKLNQKYGFNISRATVVEYPKR